MASTLRYIHRLTPLYILRLPGSCNIYDRSMIPLFTTPSWRCADLNAYIPSGTVDPLWFADCDFKRQLHKAFIAAKETIWNRMLGGVVYETSQHPSSLQFHGQDWSAMSRKDKLMNDGSIQSPTYAHLSPTHSAGQGSPYHVPQTIVLPPGAGYQVGYQNIPSAHPTGMHIASGRGMQPNQHMYYQTPAATPQELYQTPGPAGRGKVSPNYESQPMIAQHSQGYEATPSGLLTTQSLGRSYDTTIPQYYPVTTDARAYNQSGGAETGQKRKREKAQKNTPTGGSGPTKPAKSAKKNKPRASSRGSPAVIAKVEEGTPYQLPTPPSTIREPLRLDVPRQGGHDRSISDVSMTSDMMLAAEAQPVKRRGVVVTRDQDTGRRLGIVGSVQGEEVTVKTPDELRLSPRTRSVPALSTNHNGQAVFSTDQVLESEMAWLEYPHGTSPPSSPDLMQLHTPHLEHESMIIEEKETPMTKAEKVAKRLNLFDQASVTVEEPMISTRIDMFGRVAVRKAVAKRFLGLDENARLIEETQQEDEASDSATPTWSDKPSSIASSSKTILRPSWPDAEAPWALAGGSKKAKKEKEEEGKAAALKRYLETASDDSSDEEGEEIYTGAQPWYAPGRSKSIYHLVGIGRDNATSNSSKRQVRTTPDADAKNALLSCIRDRPLPPMPIGKVACACGATQPLGLGPMIECSGCKTWHHLACCGIGEDTMIGPQWWCPRCQATALAMSTPARSNTPRVYSQSDERSSAFKGEMTNIALAPSPMFVNSSTFTQLASHAKTPLNRTIASPTSRQHRSRILSYGTDMWAAYGEDGAPSSVAPSTPGPSRPHRFTTPKIEDTPFDVTSTPSRHLDFNFGQPSLFSLTPIAPGSKSRLSTTLLDYTPFAPKSGKNGSIAEGGISKHDFLKELGKGDPATPVLASPLPGTRPHALLGAHNLSPSPFGHRRSMSNGKTSSVRSSSKSGLGLGMAIDKDEE